MSTVSRRFCVRLAHAAAILALTQSLACRDETPPAADELTTSTTAAIGGQFDRVPNSKAERLDTPEGIAGTVGLVMVQSSYSGFWKVHCS